jgi:hypothetical protein
LKAAVCPLPERVYLSAASARNTAKFAVSRERERIETDFGPGPYIARLFFTTCTAFKLEKCTAHARAASGEAFAEFIAQIHMPHFVWIMEVAPLDTYRSGRSCAEVVIDASAGQLDPSVIYVRVGNVVHYGDKKQLEMADCHPELPIFTHNLGRLAPTKHPQPTPTVI